MGTDGIRFKPTIDEWRDLFEELFSNYVIAASWSSPQFSLSSLEVFSGNMQAGIYPGKETESSSRWYSEVSCHFEKFLNLPIKELPIHLGSEKDFIRIICNWRLRYGFE